MSANGLETSPLLEKSTGRVNWMPDTTRDEEEFYRKNSPWGQYSEKYRSPCLVYTIRFIALLIVYLSVIAIEVWTLVQALKFFLITTQPAITVIIVSAMLILITVVMTFAIIASMFALRFGGASKEYWGTPATKFATLGSVVTLVVAGLSLLVLGTVTAVLTNTYLPDANALSANSSFDNYLTNQTIQETWDMAQEDLKCCGLNSFTDYENLFNNLSVPVSCCNTTHPLVNQSTCPEIVTDATLANQTSQIYTEGCVSHLESFYQNIFTVVGWYCISWGILLVLAITLKCLRAQVN